MLLESTTLALLAVLLGCPPDGAEAKAAEKSIADHVRAAVVDGNATPVFVRTNNGADADDVSFFTENPTGGGTVWKQADGAVQRLPAGFVTTCAPDGDGNVTVHAHASGDDAVQSIRVEEKDGVRRVWVNGKEVPADRVKETDHGVMVLDEKGAVISDAPGLRFKVGDGQDVKFGGKVVINGEEVDINDLMEKGEILFQGEGDQPRVIAVGKPRIGVSMSPLDTALGEHLKIKDDGAFIITEVVKGLPAEKAGIRKHDVVVRVNGGPASMEGLRQVVENAKPGDAITVRIVRQGETNDFEIKVDSDSDRSTMRSFDVQVDSDSDFDFDSDNDFDFDSDNDFDFDMDFDFDDERINVEDIHRKIMEAMKDGRFQGWVERFEHLPHLKDLNLDELKEFNIHLRDAQELPLRIREHLGDDFRWDSIAEHLDGAMRELDPEMQEKIKESVRKAMEGARQKFQVWQEGDEPRMFELFEGAGDDDDVIIFHEGAPMRIIERAPAAEGGEQGVIIERRAAQPDGAGDSASDRLRRLEERMERLEAMLERIADRLEGDRQ